MFLKRAFNLLQSPHIITISVIPARHLPAMLRNARRAGRSRPSAIGFASSDCRAGSGEAGGAVGSSDRRERAREYINSVICHLSSVICHLSSDKCPLPSVLYPLPSAVRPLSSDNCAMRLNLLTNQEDKRSLVLSLFTPSGGASAAYFLKRFSQKLHLRWWSFFYVYSGEWHVVLSKKIEHELKTYLPPLMPIKTEQENG
jgi:hypothetical protein